MFQDWNGEYWTTKHKTECGRNLNFGSRMSFWGTVFTRHFLICVIFLIPNVISVWDHILNTMWWGGMELCLWPWTMGGGGNYVCKRANIHKFAQCEIWGHLFALLKNLKQQQHKLPNWMLNIFHKIFSDWTHKSEKGDFHNKLLKQAGVFETLWNKMRFCDYIYISGYE